MIYDIAVIGAGPAGSTFARMASGSGQTILLVNGQNECRKKPCGGLLAPDAQKVLAHFDLVLPKNVLANPQIFSVKTMDLCRKTVRYYPRYYLNMNRFAFDRWLLSLVPDPVEVVSGKCVRIEKQDDVFQLTVNAGGQDQRYQCRQIVGADGANSIVRRTFYPRPILQYVAIQNWFQNTGKSNPFYSCIFDPTTSESCSWLMFKDDSVIYGGCFQQQNCREAFERQKKRVSEFLGYEFGERQRTESCLVDRPKRFGDFVTGKDSVYLVGEAAGLISASSFEGISSAILSGSLLANAFIEAKDGRDVAKAYRRETEGLRFKLYLKTVKRWFLYTPWVRNLIMQSGWNSIEVQQTKGTACHGSFGP